MAIKKILEAIFEQDFMDTSYGFRPIRGCHDALKQIDKIIMTCPVNFIVDMDISKFFWHSESQIFDGIPKTENCGFKSATVD